jgi:hypothetical protein
MAKTPPHLTDEDIIRLRDGDAETRKGRLLDGVERRKLALMRLRALAFATPRRPAQATLLPDQINDDELLAYLLDTVTDADLPILESRLRSNSNALARLVDLYAALTSSPDTDNLKSVERASRDVVRHIVAYLDVRRSVDGLQFKPREPDDPDQGSPGMFALGSSAAAPRYAPSASRSLAPAWLSDQDARIEIVIDQLLRNLRHGLRYSTQIKSTFSQHDDPKRLHKMEIETAATRLRRILVAHDALRRVGTRIQEGLRDLDDALKGLPETSALGLWDIGEFHSDSAVQKLSDYASASFNFDKWKDTYSTVVGPWRLRLEGSTLADAPLSVELERGNDAEHHDLPDVTLIQPEVGFSNVALDKDGRGTCPLPQGDCWLLIQADAVWQIAISSL